MASKETEKKTSFEEALAALEKIVQDLENGQVPLADLVKKYTEGVRYLNVCQEHLHAAEMVLEQINEKSSPQTQQPTRENLNFES